MTHLFQQQASFGDGYVRSTSGRTKDGNGAIRAAREAA